VWLLPLSTSIGAIVAWAAWCDTELGTLVGGVLIATSGLLVFSLSLEALEHRGGFRDILRRTGLALGLGLVAAGLAFVAAGIGHELHCPFLFD
jgi:hypothetical protein